MKSEQYEDNSIDDAHLHRGTNMIENDSLHVLSASHPSYNIVPAIVIHEARSIILPKGSSCKKAASLKLSLHSLNRFSMIKLEKKYSPGCSYVSD